MCEVTKYQGTKVARRRTFSFCDDFELFSLCQVGMADEPPLQRFAANENLPDLHAVALTADGEGLARGGEREADVGEQGHGDEVLGVGRRVGVYADGGEHIPCRHLAGIVHASVGQPLRAHAVVVVEQSAEHLLRFFLSAYEVVGEGQAVARLIAVTIKSEVACEVPCLIASVRLAEERVEFLFDGLGRRIEADGSVRIVRREEHGVPCVGLPIHVTVIRIVGAEVLNP